MALTKDYTFKGVLIKQAYIRVSNINIQRVFMDIEFKKMVQFQIEISATPESEVIEGIYSAGEFEFDLSSDLNIFEQCYKNLKDQDAYSDAIDV